MSTDRVRLARRRLNSALIAVEPLLSNPYPDAPNLTPWTRFVGPALKELAAALDEPAAPSAPADPAERRTRYAAAMALRDGDTWPTTYENDEADYLRRADAAIAVADAEQTTPLADRYLRDRIAEALAEVDGWQWADGFDRTRSPSFQNYLRYADAVLAAYTTPALDDVRKVAKKLVAHARGFQDVLDESDRDPWARLVRADLDELRTTLADLPAPADRAAVLREAADELHKRGKPTCVEEDGDCCWFDAERELRRMADEAQQQRPARPDGVYVDPLATAVEESRRVVVAALADALLALLPEHGDQTGVLHAAADRVAAAHGGRHWTADVLRGIADETRQTEVFGPDVVAYRDPHHPRALLCREHGDGKPGLIPQESDDLPDGGICTECGADVLVPQAGEGR
ncbi:hypothetical protein [Streptomyces formicae]